MRRFVWAAVAIWGMTLSQASAAPEVVVSIKPIHSLVAGVMRGVGAPGLLVRGGGSPHMYSLRPSDARALVKARMVFWMGGGMEQFLEKPLKSLAHRARVIDVSKMDGLMILPARRGGLWEAEVTHEDATGRSNPHVWLDPLNAQIIVRGAARALAKADPPNAKIYGANGRNLIERLSSLDQALRARLAPVARTPYVVFHDAYPYFEKRYGLNAVGSVTVSPGRTPGARRISQIRAKLRSGGAVCVFSEPGFRPALIRTLVSGSGARAGVLDPLGAVIAPGPDMYFSLMRGLADSLTRCLTLTRPTRVSPLK